jgi:pyruvate/2-oxoglutarate dehydrogenase complex dihydrolipoamide dehydrogenase (E3) component/uncharacterized membrane protein YdjX (TVP38/TMEM64 family)
MKKKLVLLLLILLAVAFFFALNLQHYFSLESIKAELETLSAFDKTHPVETTLLFFIIYVLVTALSLPGAAIMTLLAGALFGLFGGTVLVSFASTIGASLAFLVARYLLNETVQEKFSGKLSKFNQGIKEEGAFYLFTLRLVPIFPFFMINILMGLTLIPLRTFYWVSQLGMLPGTIVYVNAGLQLGALKSLTGIFSPALLFSFALLGFFPLIAKKTISAIKHRALLKSYRRPKQFSQNLVVIGAGSAGLVSSYIASLVKAKVTLIESDKMGGDCLNTGCVPSKALIKIAKTIQSAKTANKFGLPATTLSVDFKSVMAKVQEVIKKIEPHDSPERYQSLGVTCLKGEAKILSPFEVQVGEKKITTRNIIIATGARPLLPPIVGLESIDYLTSDTLWELDELPKRLLVLGGGPIGTELSQCFARLGSEVTQVEMQPRLLAREDVEVSELIQQTFVSESIKVLVEHRAKEFRREGKQQILICEHQGQEVVLSFDKVLIALGREARVTGSSDTLNIKLSPKKTIGVNDFLQTNYPNIYACGDVVGPYQFTHVAAHQAWYATVNALFGRFRRFRVDYSVVPWVTYSSPEVARVGLNELEAKEKNIEVSVTTYPLCEQDRAITDGETKGFIKLLTPPGRDTILGVTIVGENAGEMIAEYVLAMRHKLGLNAILKTIHSYPTLADGNKSAAGLWKLAHKPKWALAMSERYLKWLRGE